MAENQFLLNQKLDIDVPCLNRTWRKYKYFKSFHWFLHQRSNFTRRSAVENPRDPQHRSPESRAPHRQSEFQSSSQRLLVPVKLIQPSRAA
jgi:hypothetical protein